MNYILINSKYVEYYTYLDTIFLEIDELSQYTWLITDLVCYDSELCCKDEPIILDGLSLQNILIKKKFQIIWGVFSGFKNKEVKIPKELPYADGNPSFWNGHPIPQAENATIEIVCWDSTCTLFINVNESISRKLLKIYPDIKDLDEINMK